MGKAPLANGGSAAAKGIDPRSEGGREGGREAGRKRNARLDGKEREREREEKGMGKEDVYVVHTRMHDGIKSMTHAEITKSGGDGETVFASRFIHPIRLRSHPPVEATMKGKQLPSERAVRRQHRRRSQPRPRRGCIGRRRRRRRQWSRRFSIPAADSMKTAPTDGRRTDGSYGMMQTEKGGK